MTIYVVRGSAGEYSDRVEWCVKAFTDEDAAKAHVVRCTERARELRAEWSGLFKAAQASWPLPRGGSEPVEHARLWAQLKALRNEYDPNGKKDHMHRPGDNYWYETIDLEST